MSSYRRAYIAGATYFFTVNLADRKARLLIEHVGELRRAFADTREALRFDVNAIVILPDHLHCVWTLPPGDCDFSTRWRRIKAAFSHAIAPRESPSRSRTRKGEREIWQRRFWEHCIRDAEDYAAHMNYTHYNPVKHGYVKRVADWPYSSFHKCVREGLYPADWGSYEEPSAAFGERRSAVV